MSNTNSNTLSYSISHTDIQTDLKYPEKQIEKTAIAGTSDISIAIGFSSFFLAFAYSYA